MPRAFIFDAYGTLFDVHSVQQRCEGFWPGKGLHLSQLWRAKQLEYIWQGGLMRRHALREQYLNLALFPDVQDALGAKSFGFEVNRINRAGVPVDRLGFEPDRNLKGLFEL